MDQDALRKRKRADQQRYRYNNKRSIRMRYLKSRYGLSIEQFDEMAARQRGLCAICGLPPRGRWKRLHVDHDHATGNVRGLLCHACNILLGHAKDDSDILKKAVAYLAKVSL